MGLVYFWLFRKNHILATLFHLQNSTTFQLMMGCTLFVHNIQRLSKQRMDCIPFCSLTLEYFPQQKSKVSGAHVGKEQSHLYS